MACAARIREELTPRIQAFQQRHGRPPGLAVVLAGQNPASEVYVRNKIRTVSGAGCRAELLRLEATAPPDEALALVGRLNDDDTIDAILVQSPLPESMGADAATRVFDAIDPAKDVDGFHPYNVGRLVTGNPLFQPCTPYGVMKMIEHTGIDLTGKEVVVVGRSNIVGKPVALMCLAQHATVTICHSRTRDLSAQVAKADVLIAAVGRAEMIKGSWIKPGAVVIDVGVNRVGDKKLVGDVEFDAALQRAGAITPVPGGVGPMTITMLLYNTLVSAKRRVA